MEEEKTMLNVKGTYLYEEEKPFFYLGDTAWLLFDKLEKEDIQLYLKNRKSLGYTVIQSVLVYIKDSDDPTTTKNKNIHSLSYWNFVKDIVHYAKTLGLVFGLLPCWGSVVKKGILHSDNALKYALFLSDFFKDCDNILWILGGDARGDFDIKTYQILGKTLKEKMPYTLITFHPFGRTGSYLWFNDADWLDFNMFQSGHRRYDQMILNAKDDQKDNEDSFGEDNYKYIQKSRTYSPIKPILDGEPSYEGIVQGLHDWDEPYWEARQIRRYAYWSILEGACGFTYGNNAIMQFHEKNESGNYGVRETWKQALHAVGGAEMQYVKELFYTCHLSTGQPHPEYILNQKERHHRVSCFASKNYIICYTYMGDKFDLNLEAYKGKTLDGYWQNPENNSKSYFTTLLGGTIYTFRPTKKRELSNDWLLILEVHHE